MLSAWRATGSAAPRPLCWCHPEVIMTSGVAPCPCNLPDRALSPELPETWVSRDFHTSRYIFPLSFFLTILKCKNHSWLMGRTGISVEPALTRATVRWPLHTSFLILSCFLVIKAACSHCKNSVILEKYKGEMIVINPKMAVYIIFPPKIIIFNT